MGQPWPLIRLRQTGGVSAPHYERPLSAPDAGIQVFGVSSLTGRPETWQFETHLSFSGMEQFDEAAGQNAARDERSHMTQVLVYRPFWSHRPDDALQALRKARYLQITVFQVGLGSEGEFQNVLGARRSRMDGINLDRPELAYQSLFGPSTGTIYVISPLASLKSLDDGVSRSGAGYLRSSGAPPSRGVTPAVAGGSADLAQENMLFRIHPRLSAVSADVAEADPEFWRQK